MRPGPETGAACSLQTPLDSQRMGGYRDPIFITLDAMIAMGYGAIPQPEIPENWRDIPREVNQQDRERVRAEQLTPEKERIAAIDEANLRDARALAAQVLANEAERRKRGRPRVQVSEAWLALVAARRARRTQRVNLRSRTTFAK